jgi:hypothetical protein
MAILEVTGAAGLHDVQGGMKTPPRPLPQALFSLHCGAHLEPVYLAIKKPDIRELAGGERHDPPLLLQLDEVAKICPLPVPALLADSGGRGIMMIIACQGLAQIEERWGKPSARMVLDTSNQLYVSGIQDPDTLKNGRRLVRERDLA